MVDYYKYPCIAFTGGGDGALDAIDGSILKDGDSAYVDVAATGIHAVMILDADNGGAENSPYVVSPDSNAGDKRWVLSYAYADGEMTSFIQTGTGAVTRVSQDKIRECRFSVKDFGAVGNGVANDTAAINLANAAMDITYQQYGQTASNQLSLYFPSGIYLVTPGGLDYIQGNIDAHDAVFKASADSAGHILLINHPGRNGWISIRGIMGSSCDFLMDQNPTRDANTIGMLLNNAHTCNIDIGTIIGCNVGLQLDSYYGDENNATSDNIIRINRLWWNNIGIYQRAGTHADEGRSESNEFWINYMVAHAYHIWLDSSTNSGGKVQDNHYRINTIECNYAANEVGIYTTGHETFNNVFDVIQKVNPSGTGAFILNGDGINNIFNIPYEDIANWATIIQMGNHYNIYRNENIRSNIYAATYPTVGRWQQGDRVWNALPAAGNVPGWICTTSGTPGTWKAMAILAA